MKIEEIGEGEVNEYINYIRRVIYGRIASVMIDNGFSVEVKVEKKDEVKFYLESLNMKKKQEKGGDNE